MKAQFFDSAFPGSMADCTDGDYVKREDNESLVSALLQNIEQKDRMKW